MNSRPKILIVLAFLHIIAPLGNTAFNAWVTHRPIGNYFLNLLKSSYLQVNWPIIVSPIVAGLAIYACKKWSFFVYLAAITVLFYFSYQGYLSKSGAVGLAPLLSIYVVNILVVGYFLIPAVREVYFDPRLRWWESDARYRCELECEFSSQGETHQGVVTNISRSGLFLKTDSLPSDNDIVDLSFQFDKTQQNYRGHVVYHDRQARMGIGIKFDHTKESAKAIKQTTRLLEKLGQKINRGMGMEESFFLWLRNLVQSGRGLIPTKHEKYRN